jgi:hypothetical protein
MVLNHFTEFVHAMQERSPLTPRFWVDRGVPGLEIDPENVMLLENLFLELWHHRHGWGMSQLDSVMEDLSQGSFVAASLCRIARDDIIQQDSIVTLSQLLGQTPRCKLMTHTLELRKRIAQRAEPQATPADTQTLPFEPGILKDSTRKF